MTPELPNGITAQPAAQSPAPAPVAPPAEPQFNENLDPEHYIDAYVVAGTYGGKLFKGHDTPSMLGTGYNKGWLVVVPQEKYDVNDDVTYKNKHGGHTTHRITHVKPGFVYTKGINNREGDGWIPVSDIVGKVKWPKPKM
jgi:hypothetical protein